MLKTHLCPQQTIQSKLNEYETSQYNSSSQLKINIFQGRQTNTENNDQNFNFKFHKNLISLDSKEEVQSVSSKKSHHSQQMDIDEQNDIVNDLSYIQQLQKNDQQDQMFSNLSPKQRILYANTKKHQGNQHFRQNNLQEAIQAYKFGLSLLKPQSFVQASPTDCLAMAELTSNILYNMGTCYFILMSFRYAIKFYDQAILIKPNYVKAIHNRALCHMEQGNILSAYNDIKLAYNYDKQNISIQNDLKKIQEEYYSSYRHYNFQKPDSFLDLPDKKILSKSMMENNFHAFILQPQSNNSNQKLPEQQNYPNHSQLSRLSEQKYSTKNNKNKKEQSSTNNSRSKIKSFYGKKFFTKQLQKPSKVGLKQILPSTINSPKFRPYILNKTTSNRTRSFQLFQNKKHQNFQRSIEQVIDKQEKIMSLVQNQVVQAKQTIKDTQQNQKNPKKVQKLSAKNKKDPSREKRDKDNQQKLWGYIPIVVATGFGLYHSLRAVLGK